MAKNRSVGLDLRVLEDREVLVNFSDDPIIDKKTGAFVGEWESLGLEPTDSQHGHTREVSSNTTNLTGGQSSTSYTAGAITGAVDGIAGSPVMRYIENPGAVVQDGTTYGKHSDEVAKGYVAFVHKFTSGLVRIWVSREKADLVVNERATAKDPQARPVTITFNNGDDERYYEERFYVVGEDGTVVRVEEKVFKDVEDVAAQIEAGTAFHPQASASGLTAMVVKEDKSGDATLHEYEDPKTGETAENSNEGVRPSDEPAPSRPSTGGTGSNPAGGGDTNPAGGNTGAETGTES